MGSEDFPDYDHLLNEVWEEVVEPHLQQPTFITDQPTWLTPLCERMPMTRRIPFALSCSSTAWKSATPIQELNDPVLQRQRFAEQLAAAEATGDDESGSSGTSMKTIAKRLSMAVCGGQGIGIDRLVMLLTGAESIRDVILPGSSREKSNSGLYAGPRCARKAR